MITKSKAANAVGGKTARACDSCLCKRARWYCASDDAFLCQGCNASVHSANQLASRHERVRLGTASFRATAAKTNSPPTWHHGFTRKPRTQRPRKDRENITNNSPVVPEIGSEEASNDDSEEQLLYRVPVFDPFDAELCNAFHQTDGMQEVKGSNGHVEPCDFDNLNGFLQSDMELAEFAADVESLLGTGLDDDSCGIGMEELGLMDCKEVDCFGGNRMKVEDEEVEAIIACSLVPATREMLDWNFDYESPVTGEEEEEEEEKTVTVPQTEMMNGENKKEARRKILLRLNYEEVITAWDNQRCPWTNGCRPEFNPDEYWPDFMGIYGGGVHQPYGSSVDGGREARVSRYREKRRTRLFSKKIRYEVRKLNAEKRPRMKGRFVKRTSFPQYLLNK